MRLTGGFDGSTPTRHRWSTISGRSGVANRSRGSYSAGPWTTRNGPPWPARPAEPGLRWGRIAAAYIEMNAAAPNCYGGVWLLRRDGPGVVLICDALWIHRRELRGRGLGRKILARQLGQAQRLGIDRIETIAGRSDRENGYYSWPRFGFDGRLPRTLRRRLPAAWKHVRRVLDLMRSEAGRHWWKTHGITLPLAFELADGSRCWQAFRRYRRGAT